MPVPEAIGQTHRNRAQTLLCNSAIFHCRPFVELLRHNSRKIECKPPTRLASCGPPFSFHLRNAGSCCSSLARNPFLFSIVSRNSPVICSVLGIRLDGMQTILPTGATCGLKDCFSVPTNSGLSPCSVAPTRLNICPFWDARYFSATIFSSFCANSRRRSSMACC
jgi:hypothetical protein